MPKIFISYRRDDSAYVAHSIFDKLARHYGRESVVFDVDTIPRGFDFVKYLNQQVSECDVLLAIIGDKWLGVEAPDGKQRIDHPNDFVRIEIQAALKRDIPVIPVLVGKASMPTAGQLPRGLKPLSRRNAAEVRAGRDLQRHLERIVQDVDVAIKLVLPTPVPMSAKEFDDLITNSIEMKLKRIDPGTFVMGEGEEKHQVSLTEPFWLGIYPVTQAQYQRAMGDNPSHFKGDDRRPVENVDWFNAIQFCNRLSEQEGLPSYYDVQGQQVTIRGGDGYRLPTEAEWEYACRAGTTTAYCFGDDASQLDEYAWYDENSGNTTHPVGEKQPNAWGLYDMHGNVSEWCWDWYDKYPIEPQENPTGPPVGADRVLRGGSWFRSAGWCRAAYRCRFGAGLSYWIIGFRVCLVRSSVRQD